MIITHRVYLDDNSGNGPVLVHDTGCTAITNIVTLTKLKTGFTYTVTVTSVNQIGESQASNQIQVNVGVAPSQISNLQWSASTTTSVTVSWGLPQSTGGLMLTKFTVYYDVGQTGVFTAVHITNTFQRTFQLTN